jgi:hypothetical protein
MAKRVAAGFLILALTGCASSAPPSDTVEQLRERFVAAGGDCTDATPFDLAPAAESIRCANGAKLHTVDSDADRSSLVDYYLESDSVRARTHIMLGAERWIIVDEISTTVVVMPQLGGIIQGRNGANP